jgi:hypothetical protein
MKRECIICGREFTLDRNSKGYANRCFLCNENVEEPERLGAEVSWSGKHTVEINIVPLSVAQKFNAKNKRFGVSILSSIAQGQSTGAEREATGMDSGANPGSSYRSKLRESRNLKR